MIDPVILDLYVENPNNREELIFGATMLLPSIATTGSETLVEISTYIDLYNNDAFHMFLEDLFGYESVNVYGRGELLITTDFPGCNHFFIVYWFIFYFSQKNKNRQKP